MTDSRSLFLLVKRERESRHWTNFQRKLHLGENWPIETARIQREADEAVDKLRETVLRAAFIAEHLMQMIPRETWRATGGDDGQGHYEGDYREASTFEEIQAWKALAG